MWRDSSPLLPGFKKGGWESSIGQENPSKTNSIFGWRKNSVWYFVDYKYPRKENNGNTIFGFWKEGHFSSTWEWVLKMHYVLHIFDEHK